MSPSPTRSGPTLNNRNDSELDGEGWNGWWKATALFMSSSHPRGSDTLTAGLRMEIEKRCERRAREERDGRQLSREGVAKEKRTTSKVGLGKRAFQAKEEEAETEVSLRKKALKAEAEQRNFLAETKRGRLETEGSKAEQSQDHNLREEGEFVEEIVRVGDFRQDQARILLAEAWRKLEKDEQGGEKGGICHRRKTSEKSLSFRTEKASEARKRSSFDPRSALQTCLDYCNNAARSDPRSTANQVEEQARQPMDGLSRRGERSETARRNWRNGQRTPTTLVGFFSCLYCIFHRPATEDT